MKTNNEEKIEVDTTESNLITHAKKEFKHLGWPGECEMQKMMCDGVLDLLQVLSNQGHSGSSGGYAINLFQTLAKYEPIGSLNGTDDEWNDVGVGMLQNNRCSRVFKDLKSGRVYDIEGKVFETESGSYLTNHNSKVYIDFPYTPTTEYVKYSK